MKRVPALVECPGGEVAERLVGTHCIVDTLPGAQIPVQGSHFQGEVVDLIELLGVVR